MASLDTNVLKNINKAIKLVKDYPHTVYVDNNIMDCLDDASRADYFDNNNLIFINILETANVISKLSIGNMLDDSLLLTHKSIIEKYKQLNQYKSNYFQMLNKHKLIYKSLSRTTIVNLVKLFKKTIKNNAYGYQFIGNIHSRDKIANATNLSVAFRGLTNCAINHNNANANVFKKYHLAQRRAIANSMKLFSSTTQKRLHKQISDLFAYDIVKVANPTNNKISIQAPTSSDVNKVANALLN